MLADGGAEAVGVVDGVDHVVPRVLEQSTKTFSEQDLVFGDHYPHGSSAVTMVPWPGVLSTRQAATERGHAVGHAGEAGPLGRDGAADAVVADAHDESAVSPPGADGDLRGMRVLCRVGERLAGDEVGRGLQAIVEAFVRGVEPDAQRRPRRQLAQRRRQSVVEAGRPDAAGQLAQLLDRVAELRDGLVELLRLAARRGEPPLDVAQGESDRHEALLGAVVEVSLQPAPLLVAGGHDPGP